MSKSKVYFSDLHTIALGDGIPKKLYKLVKALDWTCVDACMQSEPLPGSQLYNNLHTPGFVDHHDHFKNSNPEIEWRACLEQAEKIGLGNRDYDLIKM